MSHVFEVKQFARRYLKAYVVNSLKYPNSGVKTCPCKVVEVCSHFLILDRRDSAIPKVHYRVSIVCPSVRRHHQTIDGPYRAGQAGSVFARRKESGSSTEMKCCSPASVLEFQ